MKVVLMNEEQRAEALEALNKLLPKPKAAPGIVACSFCGKTQREVRKLVAGPDQFICNECVSLCVGLMGACCLPDGMRASLRETAEMLEEMMLGPEHSLIRERFLAAARDEGL